LRPGGQAALDQGGAVDSGTDAEHGEVRLERGHVEVAPDPRLDRAHAAARLELRQGRRGDEGGATAGQRLDREVGRALDAERELPPDSVDQEEHGGEEADHQRHADRDRHVARRPPAHRAERVVEEREPPLHRPASPP
jgi:hypothetical protein